MLYRPNPEMRPSVIRRTISRSVSPKREFSVGFYLAVAGVLIQNPDAINKLPENMQGLYLSLQENALARTTYSF